MMGNEFYPIIGAELGDRALVNAWFPRTWRPYLRPPFNVLPETPFNNAINFITGAGAFLHQFIFGYSGLRLDHGGLKQEFKPLLPLNLNQMTLKGITVRGVKRTLKVSDWKPGPRMRSTFR